MDRRWSVLIGEVPRNRDFLLHAAGERTVESSLSPLLSTGPKLQPLNTLDIDESYENIERYGYRSFDRQYIIADNRLISRPRPDLWRVRGPRQIFLTTLTATKFGRGPVFNVTPYVPDIDHFCGRGSKNVIPLYCDVTIEHPNITNGLMETLENELDKMISAEDLLAYVYALGATAAFSECFADELAEVPGAVHIPITLDYTLFQQGVTLGRDLLWWHTWGKRLAPADNTDLPFGRTQQIKPVVGMPESHSYDSDTQELSVGTGLFGPVRPEVWNFEVSGLKVLKSWLNYRMRIRSGRKSSPLDDIRPDRWTQTDELLRLLAILEHTVEVTPVAAELLVVCR